MRSLYHVCWKYNSETDFYSTGETFTTTAESESHKLLDILGQWTEKYPQDQYPNIKFMAMYPVN